MDATSGRFPGRFSPEAEVEEVDLDSANVRYRGKRLTEAEAERIADDVLSQTPGRPSRSGAKEKSEVVREALDDYLSRHTS